MKNIWALRKLLPQLKKAGVPKIPKQLQQQLDARNMEKKSSRKLPPQVKN